MKKLRYLFLFILFFSNLFSMNDQLHYNDPSSIINESLSILINSGDNDFAQILLQNGANPNFRKNNNTMLCLALSFYDIKMVNTLLAAGADFILENNDQSFKDLVNLGDYTLIKRYISS